MTSRGHLSQPRQSARRSLFTAHVSPTRIGGLHMSQLPAAPHRTSNFYSNRSTATDLPASQTWRPGEYLPSPSPPRPALLDISSMLSQMQAGITSEIQKLQTSITSLTDRVTKLEESNATPTTPASSSSCDSCSEDRSATKRRRLLPTALTNLVRRVHNGLPVEKRLNADEPIWSEHNAQVVDFVAEEVPSTEYSTTEVRRALQTYRKSLARKPKEDEHERRLKRSRQQRKYERRGRHVREDEKERWEMVTPSMMSDEESVGGRFKVHQPEWRSSDFNAFLEELDCRAATAHDRSHARVQRFQGTPIKCTPPRDIQEWMVEDDL